MKQLVVRIVRIIFLLVGLYLGLYVCLVKVVVEVANGSPISIAQNLRIFPCSILILAVCLFAYGFLEDYVEVHRKLSLNNASKTIIGTILCIISIAFGLYSAWFFFGLPIISMINGAAVTLAKILQVTLSSLTIVVYVFVGLALGLTLVDPKFLEI